MNGKIVMLFEDVNSSKGENIGVSISANASIKDMSPRDFATRICAVRALIEFLHMSPLEVGMLVFAITENCWPDGSKLNYGGHKDESGC